MTQSAAIAVGFPPLGTILICSLGAGLMAASGLLGAIADWLVANTPSRFLTPAVFLLGLVCHQLSDAFFVVYLPLCGVIFARGGRPPEVGVFLGFAAFSGAFNAGFFPGIQDIVLLDLTARAASEAGIGDEIYPVSHLWFSMASALVLTGLSWAMCDGLLLRGKTEPERIRQPLQNDSRNGLVAAGLAVMLVISFSAALMIIPGFRPLIDVDAAGVARYAPAFYSGTTILTLATGSAGLAFGFASHRWKSGADVSQAFRTVMNDMTPFILIAIGIGFIVKAVEVSNLGVFAASQLATVLQAAELARPALAALLALGSALADLILFSASAKWAVMAPVLVPALHQAGLDPVAVTAAFRVGDAAFNIINPIQPAAAYALVCARNWVSDMTVGRLIVNMSRYSCMYLVTGVCLLLIWIGSSLPFGLT